MTNTLNALHRVRGDGRAGSLQTVLSEDFTILDLIRVEIVEFAP
jgi:hypothetical protein